MPPTHVHDPDATDDPDADGHSGRGAGRGHTTTPRTSGPRHRSGPGPRPVPATTTLIRLTLRSLRQNVTRLLLTVVAVAVASAFLVGTQQLTGILHSTASTLMSSDYDGVDIVVRPEEGRPSLPADSAATVAAVPGVSAVNIHDSRTVEVTTDTAAPRGGDPGRVQVRPWYGPDTTVGESPDDGPPEDGGQLRQPGPGEVLVNAEAAHGTYAPGNILHLRDGSGDYDVTVAGTSPGNTADSDGVQLSANLDDYTARYTSDGVPGLLVGLDPTADTTRVMAEISAALGTPDRGNPDVRTGADLVAEADRTTTSALGFLPYLLYAFVGAALLATIFTIVNTFTVTVARRQRETALLRTLGVSRAQVTVSVLGEALLCGIAGSVLGILLGIAAVHLLLPVVQHRVSDVAVVPPEVTPETVLLPLFIGAAVTLAGVGAPARRAGKVPPLEALRQADAPPQRPSRRRLWSGVTFVAGGVTLCVLAVAWQAADTGGRALCAGAGAVAAFVGVCLVSPWPVLPLAGLLGTLGGRRRRRPAVVLASAQMRRTPVRTAGTAVALTLGLALITVTGMLGASLVHAVNSTVDSEVTADLVVAGADGLTGDPVPGPVSTTVRETPGVGTTYTVGKAPVVVGAPDAGITMVTVSDGDPTTSLDVGVTEGVTDLSGGQGVTMAASYAAEHGWRIGDLVEVGVPGQSLTARLPLQGTYERSRLLGDVVVSSTAFWRLAPGDRGLGGHRILAVAVTGDGSVDTATLRDRLRDATAASPSVVVQTPAEFAGRQTDLLERVIVAVYALCALAVVVAVLGVVNTLALSASERRREIGVLRAVGASRGLVRRTVLVESLVTSAYGGLLGVLTGLGVGFGVLGVLDDVGLTTVVVPWPLLAGVLVGSVLVGAVSAVLPAAGAARVPPVEAVAE